jgi:hypothetical protein
MNKILQFNLMKKYFLLIGCLILSSACNLGVPTPGSESNPTSTPLSAPEAETASPALASAETATPLPEPPPLFFTEEFDLPSPYWNFIQAAGLQPPLTTTSNGNLRIDFPSPDSWLVGVNVVHSYSNVFIRAKVSLTPSGSVGLICRYNEESGWYEFNAASDGTYSLLLGQWLADGIVKYIPMVSDPAKLPNGVRDLELGMYCHDGFIELYSSGALIRRFDATNYGLTDGNIGISTASFGEAPTSTLLEWLKVDEK